jgi:hypothetical protein
MKGKGNNTGIFFQKRKLAGYEGEKCEIYDKQS